MTRDELIDTLIARFDALPDVAPAGPECDALHATAQRLMHSIGWLETNPRATFPQYVAEVERVKARPDPWPDVLVLADEESPMDRFRKAVGL